MAVGMTKFYKKKLRDSKKVTPHDLMAVEYMGDLSELTTNAQDVGNKQLECVYVAPKYEHLKQEMLSNITHLLEKEDDLIKCEHAMDTTQSIEMNNLIVILMCCKFEELSYHLRATLMPHYMRILRDTVHVYGPSLKPDDELYFGVNREALFGDCKHYFACDVLSDFIYEKERLFMASSPVLIPRINIINIEHTQCGKDHWYGIHAIHTIQQMVEDKSLKRRMNDKMKQCIFEWLKPEDGAERVHKLLQRVDKIQNEEERILKRAHEDDDGKEQDPELDPDDSISCEYANFDCIAQRIYVRQEETFEGTELIYQLECDEDIQGDTRPVV
eukprot:696398_1